VYTRGELYGLAKVFEKYPRIYIISDEIYELINFNGQHESITQFDFIKDRVVLINGVSKGFSMTGWRLGYMACIEEIAKASDKLQGQITSGACSISQKAAVAALLTDPATSEDLKVMMKAFRERRDLLLGLLTEIPGLVTNVPEGAFYVFPNVKHYFGMSDGECTINDSTDLCGYLLNKVHVALVPGDAFGCPDCIRISYATSSELLVEAIERIKNGLASLK
jgi:aspartate aminotransferase